MELANNEIEPILENSSELNHDLKDIANIALTNVLNKFHEENPDISDSEVNQFLDHMDIITKALDYGFPEDGKTYQVRSQRLDDKGNAFYISIIPADKINSARPTKYDNPSIDLSRGPVNECQIVIKPFYDKKGKEMPRDPSIILETGFSIDIKAVKTFLDNNNKIQFKPLAGLRIISLFDSTADCFLMHSLGMTDFRTERTPIDSKHELTIANSNKYMSNLGLSTPEL